MTTEALAHSPYAQFPELIERDWLGRWCHLSEADIDLVNRRTGDPTRLGFAVQLATVRAIGTVLADPNGVPDPVVEVVARQLDVADPGVLAGYAKLPARWKHTAEIRERYGYVDFTSEPANGRLTRWLYRMAWNDDLGPTALFRAKMLAERVLLNHPGSGVSTPVTKHQRYRQRPQFHPETGRPASFADAPVELINGLGETGAVWPVEHVSREA